MSDETKSEVAAEAPTITSPEVSKHTIVLGFESALDSEYMVDIRYQVAGDGVPSAWFTVDRISADHDGAYDEAQRRATHWLDGESNIIGARVIQVKTLFTVKKGDKAE